MAINHGLDSGSQPSCMSQIGRNNEVMSPRVVSNKVPERASNEDFGGCEKPEDPFLSPIVTFPELVVCHAESHLERVPFKDVACISDHQVVL